MEIETSISTSLNPLLKLIIISTYTLKPILLLFLNCYPQNDP
jgi:hypothetical protein